MTISYDLYLEEKKRTLSLLPDEYLSKSPNGKPDNLNQKKLRTGIESLKQGDPHPQFPFLVLLNRVSCKRGESWGTVGQFKRKNRTDKPKSEPKTITKNCDHCKKDFTIKLTSGGLRFKKRCSEDCDRAAATLRARKRSGKKHKVSEGRRPSWERSKEQTGQEKGTFKFGDSHPTNPDYVYWGWRENIPKYKNSPEKWVPIEAYEKELVRRKKRQEKRRAESGYSKRVEKVKSLQLCNYPPSTYSIDKLKYGVIHPYQPNWVFHGYKYGSESWLPKGEFDANHASSVEYHREKRANDPDYVAREKVRNRISRSTAPGPYATRNVLRRYPELAEQIDSLSDEEHGLINQIYLHSIRLTERLGIEFEVDHTLPLSWGGLHEPSNLQVTPASWNCRKNNHHREPWPFPFDKDAIDPNSQIEFTYKQIEHFKIMQAKSVVSKLEAKKMDKFTLTTHLKYEII
jgi:hypothetical protein